MHVVVRDITGGKVPVWLNEGLAEMSERQVNDKPLQILDKAIKQDKLIPFEVLERSFFQLKGRQVLLAYEQSYDLVRFMIDRYGWHNMRDLLFALRDNQTFFAAMETVLGIDSMTYKSLQRRWLDAG
ncbi:MAG TPA: peptidase MA family metallohydrolase [Malonomonas sp.]